MRLSYLFLVFSICFENLKKLVKHRKKWLQFELEATRLEYCPNKLKLISTPLVVIDLLLNEAMSTLYAIVGL